MSRRILCLTAVVATLLSSGCATPPDKEIQQAQGAIEAARAAGADRYAPAEFNAALDALRRANDAVTDRDYRLALNRALDSRERAKAAAKEAADHKATARTDADQAMAGATKALDEARAQLKTSESGRTPPAAIAAARTEIDAGAIAVQKAGTAFRQTDYLGAIAAMQGVTARLRGATRDLAAATPASARRRH